MQIDAEAGSAQRGGGGQARQPAAYDDDIRLVCEQRHERNSPDCHGKGGQARPALPCRRIHQARARI